jgi:putative ABC transport system ATP-binding protein
MTTTQLSTNPVSISLRTIVSLRGVSKTFQRGGESVRVLDNMDMVVREGAFQAIMGPSGSGKSTLLNLIAGIDSPTAGSIEVAGAELTSMSRSQLARFRARHIGFVFQTYNLIPVLSALENVALPLGLLKLRTAERRKRAEMALDLVGMSNRKDHFPRQLSGGQEQRVAIARAIVTDPTILVADEPTGDLDRRSADDVLALLEKLNTQLGKTIVMVTHDPLAAKRAQSTLRLEMGSLN